MWHWMKQGKRSNMKIIQCHHWAINIWSTMFKKAISYALSAMEQWNLYFCILIFHSLWRALRILKPWFWYLSPTGRGQEVWLLHARPPPACCLWLSQASSANQPRASWSLCCVQTLWCRPGHTSRPVRSKYDNHSYHSFDSFIFNCYKAVLLLEQRIRGGIIC